MSLYRQDVCDDFRADAATVDASGFLNTSARFITAGVLTYPQPDGTIRRELRPPQWATHPDTLASMRLSPVTLGHPPKNLSRADAAAHMKGMTGSAVTVETGKNGLEYGKVDVCVIDGTAIDALQSGIKQASPGLKIERLDETPGEWRGQKYDAVQVGPYKINHLAIVTRARQGEEVRFDGEYTELTADNTRMDGAKMDLVLVRLDGADVKVDPASVTIVQSAEAKRAAAEASAATEKARADGLQGRLDSAPNPEAIRAAALVEARTRLDLETKAKPHLAADHRFDGQDNKALHLAVIAKVAPGVVKECEGKSDDYIAARFDGELSKMTTGQAANRAAVKPLADGERADSAPAESEYDKSLKALNAGYQGK
jgi:hypothetical protein